MWVLGVGARELRVTAAAETNLRRTQRVWPERAIWMPVHLAYRAEVIPRRVSAVVGLLSFLVSLLAVLGPGGAATAAAPAQQPKVTVGDVTVTETDGPGVVAT